MRLLVTGANGMLGHRVVEIARRRGHEVTATDLPQLDLTDERAVRAFVANAAPERIVNCAAFTAVDAAEEAEDVARRVNGDAAGIVARCGVPVVHVSTDYVFAGDASVPYVESDPPDPRTAYGRTKLEGERQVLAAGEAHAVVRTAWLFGEGGPNFVDTMRRLGRERDEVRVVADQVGSPTWTGHLAPALVGVCESGGSGIFHAAGDGSCSWFELAVEAHRLGGLDCRVVAVTSEEFVRPAPRPAFSVLATERSDGLVLPGWRAGVEGHLREAGVLV